MILNREHFPKITRDASNNLLLEYKNNTHLFYSRNWDDRDYWYCEIMTEHSFDQYNLKDIVPPDILKNIKEDETTFLCINNNLEAFQEVIKHIYDRVIIKNNIPPSKIVFISNGNDIYLKVKEVADQLKLGYISVEWYAGWANVVRRHKSNQNKLMLETLNSNKIYTKKFLNLNRRWRPHRCTLVALLALRKLLNNGYVSFAPSDDNRTWEDIFPVLLEVNKNSPNMIDNLVTFKNTLCPLPSMYVDKVDLIEDSVTDIIDDTNYFYENTLFSLITETNFYQHEWYDPTLTITEKTFKPIISLHPFILVSIAGSLAALKELGYKTFHPWINEDYDTEKNDSLRMRKIVDEVERLSNLSDEEVIEFIKHVKPIVLYNYYVITKSPTKTIKKL